VNYEEDFQYLLNGDDFCYDTEIGAPQICEDLTGFGDTLTIKIYLHFASFVISLLTFLVVTFMPGFNHIQVSDFDSLKKEILYSLFL
jgi:hypothetical protein